MDSSTPDDRPEGAEQGPRTPYERWVPWICAVVLALAWAVSAHGVVQPLVYADEGGYILNARFLAQLGEASGTFYYPGYSVVLVPAMWADADFDVVWRLIQVTNLGLLLTAFALLRAVLARLAPWPGEVGRTVVACVVCLYPAWINSASLAMSENLMLPAVLGAWWLLLRAEEQPGATPALVAGIAAGAVSVSHPRASVVAIAVFVAVVGAVLFHAWTPRRAGAAGIGLVVGVALSRLLVALAEISQDNTGSVVANLTTVEGLRDVLITLDGHLLYIAVATGGLALVGVGVLVRPRAPFAVSRAAVVLSLLGSWVLSAAFMAGGLGDKLIYGRYNEPFFAIALAVGLSWVTARGLGARHLLAVAAAIVVLAGAFAWQTDHVAVSSTVNRTNVFALLPLIRRSVPSVDWRMLATAGVVALFAVAVLAATRRTRPLVPLAVGAAFLWIGAQNADVLAVDAASRDQQGSLVERIVAIEGGAPECVTLDRRDLSQWHRFNYRVLLARTTVQQVESLDDPSVAECGPFVLSSVHQVASEVPGARLVAMEAHAGVALWVLPSDEQAALDAEGALFPAEWPSPLPEESLRASIELLGPTPTVDDLRDGARLALRVRHDGAGSPWAGQSGLGGWTAQPVRVTTSVVDDDGARLVDALRSDIPPTVAPGESFELVVELPPVPAGEPSQIVVELVAEEQAWFGEDGSLRIDVD